MMNEIERDVSDTLHTAKFCRYVFYLLVLLFMGWLLAGPMLTALERNDYQPKVVAI